MFDIGWSEMAVIALIALVVIGPKELPKLMRSIAKWTSKARGMAREFQSGIDEMVREADLDDARKAIDSAKTFNVGKTLEETIDPTGGMRDEVKDLKQDLTREADDEDGGGGGGDALGALGDASPFDHAASSSVPEPEATTPPEPEVAAVEPDPATATVEPKPAAVTVEPEPAAASAEGDGADASARASAKQSA